MSLPRGRLRLTLIALAVSPFCFGAVYMQFNFLTRITEQVDAELVKRSGDLTDYVLNIHTIHAYNRSTSKQRTPSWIGAPGALRWDRDSPSSYPACST